MLVDSTGVGSLYEDISVVIDGGAKKVRMFEAPTARGVFYYTEIRANNVGYPFTSKKLPVLVNAAGLRFL